MRAKHGMGAYATLNIPKVDKFLEEGNVVGDGLYSWSEYKILREKYGDQLTVIAVYAPPHLRYKRLAARVLEAEDTDLRNRPISEESANKRDSAEIENLEKGGPIAMADYTLVNTKTIPDLLDQFSKVMNEIGGK